MSEDNGINALDGYMDDEEDTQKDRYLTFRIGEEEFGIEIMHVLEIIGLYKITPIPEAPNFVKGVINLRGKVIPVIDVRIRFGMEVKEYDERTCTIVVRMKGVTVGLIVDTINEVLQIPAKDVDEPTSFSQSTRSKYIMGMGKVNESVKILLDVNKLLHADELDALSRTA